MFKCFSIFQLNVQVFFNIPTKYLSEYLSNNKKQTYTQTVIYHSK